MKNLPASLITWLQNATAVNKADCFAIVLANGEVIPATTAQIPVSTTGIGFGSGPFGGFPFGFSTASGIYYPSKYGIWQRGAIQYESSYTPKANTMSLTVSVDPNAMPTVFYPGTEFPLMKTIASGLFDAATVAVYTFYWGIGEDYTIGMNRGVITSFLGTVTKIGDLARDHAEFEVADMLYQLNLVTPPNLIQTSCRFQLFSPGCTLNRAAYQLFNSVASGSSSLQINLANGADTAPWWNGIITFTQGYVVFTSGQNKGLFGYIKNLNNNTQILLNAPMPFPVATGDTFTMYAGCNKTLYMCTNGFNNQTNFGGQPLVPDPTVAL